MHGCAIRRHRHIVTNGKACVARHIEISKDAGKTNTRRHRNTNRITLVAGVILGRYRQGTASIYLCAIVNQHLGRAGIVHINKGTDKRTGIGKASRDSPCFLAGIIAGPNCHRAGFIRRCTKIAVFTNARQRITSGVHANIGNTRRGKTSSNRRHIRLGVNITFRSNRNAWRICRGHRHIITDRGFGVFRQINPGNRCRQTNRANRRANDCGVHRLDRYVVAANIDNNVVT